MAAPMRVTPWVTHERIDEEVMVIHLETGAYFALEAVAADLWTGVVSGLDLDELVVMITGRYHADAGLVRRDLVEFVGRLESERLIEPAASGPPPRPGDEHPDAGGRAVLGPRPVSERATYGPPVLDKYDDLEELLLFDPIHQVDEAGWPVIDHGEHRD